VTASSVAGRLGRTVVPASAPVDMGCTPGVPGVDGQPLVRFTARDKRSPYWESGAVPDHLPEALHHSPLIEAGRERALFQLWTVGRFLVRVGEPTVVDRAPGATDSDIECLLRGPVAALRSCLGGDFALRGSAVEVRGRALVIVGTACGASSLAASLALQGHALVADGVVRIVGAPPYATLVAEARPARVTLWPDSIDELGLDPAEGEVVRPVLPSRAFALGPAPSRDSVPIAAFAVPTVDYRLGPGDALVATRASTTVQAVAALTGAQWHIPVLRDLGMQKEQFQWAAALARALPIALLDRTPAGMGLTLPSLVRNAEKLVP
jgi:hypothetical protein